MALLNFNSCYMFKKCGSPNYEEIFKANATREGSNVEKYYFYIVSNWKLPCLWFTYHWYCLRFEFCVHLTYENVYVKVLPPWQNSWSDRYKQLCSPFTDSNWEYWEAFSLYTVILCFRTLWREYNFVLYI